MNRSGRPASTATWTLARQRLRTGRRFAIALTVLAGVSGGVALAALAGARRADTAFDRLATASRASDVLVLPLVPGDDDPATLAAIPGVTEVVGVYGFITLTAAGEPLEAATLYGLDDRLGRTIERPLLRAGRSADPTAVDEIVATPAAQRALGVPVGGTVELRIIAEADWNTPDDVAEHVLEEAQAGRAGQLMRFRLVGVGIRTEEAMVDSGSIFFTPAFARATAAGPLYAGYCVRLAGGERALNQFEAAATAALPGGQVQFQTTANTRSTVNRPIGPQVLMLSLFALVVAIATVAAWGQALARWHRAGRNDAWTMVVLGMSSSAVRAAQWLTVVVIAAGTALVAVVTALVLSPLASFGEARRIEPSPGWQFNGIVVLGAFVLLVVALGVGALVTSARPSAVAEVRRPTRLGAAARRMANRPERAVGVSYAVEPDRGALAAPVRSTLVSAVAGVAAVIGTFTFAGNLGRFVSTPVEYGWGFDVAFTPGDVGPVTDLAMRASLAEALDRDPDVRGWGVTVTTQVLIGDRLDAVLGVRSKGGQPIGPTVVAGRLPSGANEVALGARTAEALGVSIGDRVPVGLLGSQREMTIVGTVILPGLPHNSQDVPALGGGAAMDLDALADLLQLTDDDELDEQLVVADLRGGASTAAFVQRVRAAVSDRGLVGDLTVVGPGLPSVDGVPIEASEVRGYRAVRSTPIVLAIVLAAMAAAAVAHALAVSVRRHRSELGALQALGMTPRQVRAAVRWQAATIAAIAVVVGVPVGLLGGRLAWRASARQLGIVDHAVLPWPEVGVLVPAVVLVVLALSATPARSVSTRPAAESLRSE